MFTGGSGGDHNRHGLECKTSANHGEVNDLLSQSICGKTLWMSPARILLTVLFVSASCPLARAAESKLPVAVSLPPYAWLAERIGGDKVEVISLLEEGEDPHSFQPPPRRVTALSAAKVWFTVAMPFEEALVEKLKGGTPGLRIVPVNEGIELAESEEHDHHEHEKAAPSEKEHEHHDDGETDPHTWLSPILLKQQAHTIAHTLGELDPTNAAVYEDQAVALEKELDALHASLTESLAPLKGTTITCFTPRSVTSREPTGCPRNRSKPRAANHPRSISPN